MTQLLIHLWGDYILQSDWMAQNKTKRWFPAAVHALLYTIPFALIAFVPMKVDVPSFINTPARGWVWFWEYDIHIPGWTALAVIGITHFFIDRYRLARYVVWAKNWMGGWQDFKTVKVHGEWMNSEFTTHAVNLPFEACKTTGYPPTSPAWLSVWLLIIADNILHLTINYLALRYL